MENEKRPRPLISRTGFLVMMALLVAALGWGCASNTVNLQPSTDVAETFQAHDLIEGYRYFHYSIGVDRRTLAIIGVKPPYTVESRLWMEIDAAEGIGPFVNDAMRWSRTPPRGYLITNPQGDEVGVWYSPLYGSSVRFADNHRVIPMVNMPNRFRGGDSI